MKKIIASKRALVILCLLASGVLPTVAAEGKTFATAVPNLNIPELVEKASTYDGKEVTVRGEIIGDVMRRGDHVWLNILQDGTAIGVWAEEGLLPNLSFIGNYSARGDEVIVAGIMRRACPEHGGDLDIHAESISLEKRGTPLAHKVDSTRLIAGSVLCFVGAGLVFLWRKRESRRKIS